jgi:hypothetical protein
VNPEIENIPACIVLGLAREHCNCCPHPLTSERRFKWNQLFFHNDFSHPMTPELASRIHPSYITCFEAVRWAPSAMFAQTCRLVWQDKVVIERCSMAMFDINVHENNVYM